MGKSSKIVVTDKRLENAFKEINTVGIGGTGTLKQELKNQLSIQLGKVVRFYPGSDKVLVHLETEGKNVRCVQSHLIVGAEFNISTSIPGTLSFDSEYDEVAIYPEINYWTLVLNIRDSDNEKEYAVLGYISRDETKILANASPGMFQILREKNLFSLNETETILQYDQDTSITLSEGKIELITESCTLNGNELTTNNNTVSDLSTTITGLQTKITELETRIKTLEDEKNGS